METKIKLSNTTNSFDAEQSCKNLYFMLARLDVVEFPLNFNDVSQFALHFFMVELGLSNRKRRKLRRS